jgi:4-amino-4-deoxy-L-arabinose transferase-like glycosyltransferase
VPLAVVLLAWAVRLQNLTYHSLWFDEAMSVHWARSDVGRILQVSMNLVEDRLPPLYYLLLHGWLALAGDGEMAARLPSVVLGVLLVVVVYRLVSGLFGRRMAALAAVLVALNPFLVWYSQEARMYALAVLLATGATSCLMAAGRATSARPAPAQPVGGIREFRWWLAYGACVLAGLYTHFYTAFLVPAHGAYLVWTWRRSRRAWLPFAAVLVVVAGLFAPLALAAVRASGEAGPGRPLDGAGERLWVLLSAFTIWKAPLAEAGAAVVAGVMGLLALGGLALPHTPSPSPLHADQGRPRLRNADRRTRGEIESGRALLAFLLAMPPLIAMLLLARNRLAFFGERYFIVMVPWLLAAIALGAERLAVPARAVFGSLRPMAVALCWTLPIVLTLIPLPGQWSPSARKEAWRETVAYLATHARAEDAILIHPDWTRYPFQYYFRGPGQTYAVFSSVDATTDLDSPLTVISTRHPVIWLVESHTELADPDHRVADWLAGRFPLVTELYPPGVAVHAYASSYRSDRRPDFATPVAATFTGGLRLVGYVLPEAHVRAADDLFHPPSGWVKVASYWETEAALHDDFVPFVHMVDGIGQVWGVSLERANDAFHKHPTSTWLPGQVIRADFDVNLNPVTPPGNYMLVVGLRDSAGVQVPLVDGAPQVAFATVEILD